MLTQEQHEIRRSGVGSSEIAQIVGCSPFGDASKLWLVKMGLWIEADTAATRAGTWLEDGVADWAANEHNWALQRCNRTLRHRKHSWMLATPDRFLLAGKKRAGLVEIKTSESIDMHEGWGEVGTDQIPRHIRCQVQQQMTVTGEEVCNVVLFTFRDRMLRHYEVPSSPALEEALTEAGSDFWHNHVVKNDPPPVDPTSAFAGRYLARVLKQLSDEVVAAPLTSDEIAEQLYRAKLDIKDAAQREETAENQLKQMVGEHKGIEGPWGRFLWSRCKGKVSEGKLVEHLMDELKLPAVMRAELRERFRGEEYRRVNFNFKDPTHGAD